MSGKTGRKALIVFQFHRLPKFYIISPRGQEKSNKRPSLDCCSFKPLKQRESPCSSLEQRPMEKVKDLRS